MSIFGKSNSTFGSSSVFGNTNSSSNNMSFGSLGKSVASINSFGTSTNQTMTSDATKFVNSNNDTKFSEPPTDTISSLVFSPTTSNIGLAGVSSFCAATCWDKSIRIWQVDHNSKNTAPKAETIAAEFPFHCSWNDNSTQLFYASSDKSAYTWDLASNQSVKFAEHTAPIQTVHHIKTPTYTAVMTTSWDSTVKFWDLRSATPMKSIDIGGKALGADCMYPAAVILNSNRKIAVLNLNNEPSIVRMDDSLLNHL
ncbi:Rae1 protein, partial [Intoshia linei]